LKALLSVKEVTFIKVKLLKFPLSRSAANDNVGTATVWPWKKWTVLYSCATPSTSGFSLEVTKDDDYSHHSTAFFEFSSLFMSLILLQCLHNP
jgi:hypothetical protein